MARVFYTIHLDDINRFVLVPILPWEIFLICASADDLVSEVAYMMYFMKLS